MKNNRALILQFDFLPEVNKQLSNYNINICKVLKVKGLKTSTKKMNETLAVNESKPNFSNQTSTDGLTNGQDDVAVRLSPSSPFVTMRHYISEFDPEANSTYMSMNDLKLAESWKIYIDTFNDLCDIDKVPLEKRKKLLFLLAGTLFGEKACHELFKPTQTFYSCISNVLSSDVIASNSAL